jgi:hypothetical protein
MTSPEDTARTLTFEQLTDLRHKTETVSKFLQEQLLSHLETLRPVLALDRVFGRYMGGRGDSPLSERAFAQLQQNYRPFTARPYDLPTQFDEHWLSLVGTRVTLYPWEYSHETRSDRETKTITMSSPVRWVVTYTSAYTLGQFRQAVSGKGERRPEHVRQFVVNALVTQLMVAHTPGLGPLLGDLRYQLHADTSPDLPKVPLTTITASLPSFRPSDDLILSAVTFSGVPAFIELIDIEALATLEDPLKARIVALVR